MPERLSRRIAQWRVANSHFSRGLVGVLIILTGATLIGSTPLTTEPSSDPTPRHFVWTRADDALTLDPHAISEGITMALLYQIYEPLIAQNREGKLVPALAESWVQTVDPLVWRFTLRPGVTFHDGSALTTQDVIFSIKRALAPSSDMRSRLTGVQFIDAVGANEIEIRTRVMDPLLPIRLSGIFIMSEAWAKSHNVVTPEPTLTAPEPGIIDAGNTVTSGTQTSAGTGKPAASVRFLDTHANGTGPYQVVSRTPQKETRLARFDAYWGWQGIDLSTRLKTIVYQPIASSKDRITALLDGSVDFVQDVPLGELEVLRQAPNMTISTGPENRVIFLGLSIKKRFEDRDNPLTHHGAREALAKAVNRTVIQRKVMMGQSIPTAVLAPPGINGFPRELDEIPPVDVDGARKLLKEAGVAEGTPLDFDCPDNRYANDAAICREIAEQFATVGLNVTPKIRPRAQHFARVRAGKSQMYLMGWGVPTFDSAYIFTNLFHSHGKALGAWNGTGFANTEVDEQIDSLSSAYSSTQRSRTITDLWFSMREARIYIPLHVQTLTYAMHNGVTIHVDLSDQPRLMNAVVNPAKFKTD